MFELRVVTLPSTLTARQDAPDHATVEPAAVVQFDAYNADVQGTRVGWVRMP